MKRKKLTLCMLAILTSIFSLTAQVDVVVNLNMEHSVGGVSDFGRERHITLHSSLGENDWNGEYEKMDYLMNDLDVYFGRDNGGATWEFGQTPPNTDSLSWPGNHGYPDLDAMVSAGEISKANYENLDAQRLQYESRSGEMIRGTNPHPTYPSFSWDASAWTSTNPSWSPTRIETSADWVTQYLDKYFAHTESEQGEQLPKYWEVINEPDMKMMMNWGGIHTSLDRIFEYHNLVAEGVRARLGDNAPLIGGMTWGQHDLNRADGIPNRYDCQPYWGEAHEDFLALWDEACISQYPIKNTPEWFQWDAMWKGFMDAAGENMDFYSIHLYDWINWTNHTYSTQRTGGPTEAVLDLVDWYQNYKFNEPKPIVLSEYGAIVDQSNLSIDPKFKDWANLRTFSHMLMQFLERPDLIVKSMPFAPVKAEWGDYTYEGTLYRYPITMMNKDQNGDWQWREIIKWYELWSEVKGTRVDTKSSDLDIQVDAYVDGNDVYLILNSLELSNTKLNLHYLHGTVDSAITNIQMKRLYLDKSLGSLGQPVLSTIDYDRFPETITLNPEETAIIKYSYANPRTVTETSTEIKYYGEPLSSTDPYRVSGTMTGHINNVTVPAIGEATLRICGSWPSGAIFSNDTRNTITVNGNELELTMDWRGNPSYTFWFGVLEVDVPLEYLSTNNEVYCSLVAGGDYATISLQVWDFSTQPLRISGSSNEQYTDIPSVIQAEHCNDYSNVSIGSTIIEHYGTGDWVEFNVNALVGGEYVVRHSAASDRSGTIQLNLYIDDSTTPITTDITNPSGWFNFQTYTCTIPDLTPGQHVIRVEAVNDVNYDWIEFSNGQEILVESINLNRSSYSLEPGESAQMIAEVYPASANNPTISWSSDNPTVLTIDQDGLVTTLTEGTATVSASTTDGSNISETCVITVAAIQATGVSLEPVSATIALGESISLAETVTPDEATDKSVTWSSSNISVASVDEDGVVTGNTIGNATITVTTNSGGHTATSDITVEFVNVTDVSLNTNSLTLVNGESSELSAEILPANASNKSLSWNSGNNSIATVVDGVVTAVAEGSTIVRVTSDDTGVYDECAVTVLSDDGLTITLEAEDFDTTGGTVNDAAWGGPGAGVAVENNNNIYWVNGGDWAEYEFTVPEDGTYLMRFYIACPNDNATITCFVDDEEISFNNIPNNGKGDAGWNSYETVQGDTVSLNAGTYTFRILAGTGLWAWNLDYIEFLKIETQDPVGVTGVTVSPTTGTVDVGSTIQLLETVLPDTATNKNVSWSSDNEAVATVSIGGLVSGITEGIANITVTTDDGGFTAKASITVVPVPVTGVSVDPASITVLDESPAQTITATIEPDNATNKSVTWSSSDEDVASVVNGVVTIEGVGNTTITVTTEDGGYTANTEVTVQPIVVTGVELNHSEAIIDIGGTAEFVATVLPENATDQSVTWSSGNTGIATVSNGVVTGIANGEVTITVTTTDGGYTAEATVTVDDTFEPVTGVSITSSATTIMVGDTVHLHEVIAPDNASNKNVDWIVEFDTVASLQLENGVAVITGEWVGETDITVETQDGGYTDIITITVNPVSVTDLTLNTSAETVVLGNTTTLIATIVPDNATFPEVSWSSSNTDIVTVDDNGEVSGLSVGTAIIRATSVFDNSIFAEATITVDPVNVTDISVSPVSEIIVEGDSIELSESITPENATNQTVRWVSSDDTKATVTDGVVKGVGVGEATIYVITNDGNFTASSTITVLENIPASFVVDDRDKYLTTDYYIGGTLDVTTYYNAGTGNTVTDQFGGIEYFIREMTEDWALVVNDYTISDSSVIGTQSGTSTASIPIPDTILASSELPEGNFYFLWMRLNTAKGDDYVVNGLHPINIVHAPVKVTAVSLSSNGETIEVDQKITLTAVVSPSNAANKNVSWVSSDPEIASVDNNGVVTGHKAGETTITVKTEDGDRTATVTIVVETGSGINHSAWSQITLYPNPANNMINLKGLPEGFYTLSVINTQGAEIINLQSYVNEKETVDISQLPEGIYILNIKSEKTTKSLVFNKIN